MNETMVSLPPADLFNLILIVAALIVCVQAIRTYGKSTVSAAFLYFLVGTALLGFIRVFLVLTESKTLTLSEETIVIWWHLFFYLGIVAFILGTRTVLRLVALERGATNTEYPRAIHRGVLLVSLLAILYFIASPLDQRIHLLSHDNVIFRFGTHHFIAFVLAGFAAIYTHRIGTRLGGTIASIALPLLIAFSFASLIHLWELLTESWKVLTFTDDFIETVERWLAVPQYVAFLIAFWRAWRLNKRAVS